MKAITHLYSVPSQHSASGLAGALGHLGLGLLQSGRRLLHDIHIIIFDDPTLIKACSISDQTTTS